VCARLCSAFEYGATDDVVEEETKKAELKVLLHISLVPLNIYDNNSVMPKLKYRELKKMHHHENIKTHKVKCHRKLEDLLNSNGGG
jgi:hypothetical protein